MSDKTERTKEEILSDLTGHPIGNHNEDLLIEVDVCLKAMEEYRQSSPVESPDEFAMKFLEYASGLAVSNYKSGGHWYLSDGRIVKTADILKQFKSELEEPKEK